MGQVIGRLFRETHHAAVLESWGLLWIWHSLVLLVLCGITNVMSYNHVSDRLAYLFVWGGGVSAWAAIFWHLRRRSGPITFVERQVAHVWASSVISSSMLYGVEYLLNFQPLALSPVLSVISGSVFLVKAGILSGAFYIQAAALYLTTIPMCLYPQYGQTMFGVVSALWLLHSRLEVPSPTPRDVAQNRGDARRSDDHHPSDLRPARSDV